MWKSSGANRVLNTSRTVRRILPLFELLLFVISTGHCCSVEFGHAVPPPDLDYIILEVPQGSPTAI